MGNRGLLARVNKQLRVFHGGVLQNSVAEIQNVAVARERRDNFLSSASYFFLRSK